MTTGTESKALLTVADITAYKYPDGSASTDIMAFYANIVPVVIAHFKGRLGFDFDYKSYAQWLRGRYSTMLALPAYPVETLTLEIDGTAIAVLTPSSAKTTSGCVVALDPEWGIVNAISPYELPKGYGQVYGTFTAGWGHTYDYPADLRQAAVILAIMLENERTRIGVNAKTLGPESISQYLRNSSDYKTLIEEPIIRHTRYL